MSVLPEQVHRPGAEPRPVRRLRFGGVLVYEGTAAYEYYRGDVVEIGGYGNEYFGLTEMEPHNGDAVNLSPSAPTCRSPRASRPASWPTTCTPTATAPGRGVGEVWVKTYRPR